jgi:hypothetical protein
VIAWLAIAAILLSSAAIFGAHLEVKGVDLSFSEPPSSGADASLHASLQSFATGFSQ